MTATLISSRTACVLLTEIGLAREQARLVLACGLAGQPTELGSSLAYEQKAVESLVLRPLLPAPVDPTPHPPRSSSCSAGVEASILETRGALQPWRHDRCHSAGQLASGSTSARVMDHRLRSS